MSSFQFVGLGKELLSLMQVLFFLALGYVVAKLITYFSLGPSNEKAVHKKMRDEDQPFEHTHQAVVDEPQETIASNSIKVKSRHSNAQEKKRQRKAQQACKVLPCTGVDNTKEETPLEASAAPPPTEAIKSLPLPYEVFDSMEEETPLETSAASVLSEAEAVEEVKTSARLAKIMAKKSERKAKKALEKKAQEEQPLQDVNAVPSEEPLVSLAGGQQEELSIVAEIEGEFEVEAQPRELPFAESTPTVDLQDDLEIENAYSEDESIHVGSVHGISTPEVCLSPREMGASPLLWCGVPPPEFSSGCENVAFPNMVPQIEGWMPILLPADQAPPGAFDGVWQNSMNERIIVQHSDIIFESGVTWAMNVHSLTHISVEVENEEFQAELDTQTRCLKWSDGDVWTCIGQTENQQQWANAAQPVPQLGDAEVPCLLWEGAQVAGEPFFAPELPPQLPPQPLNTQIPEDAKDWEICWDWKKKGRCPRGAACDWYHPLPAVGPTLCKPCLGENFDRPFANEQGDLYTSHL